MVPKAEMYRDVTVLYEYQDGQLPESEARIADASALRGYGFNIVLGTAASPETVQVIFEQLLRERRAALDGELVLGPYVTWPDGPGTEPFAPSGFAIWQRTENNS